MSTTIKLGEEAQGTAITPESGMAEPTFILADAGDYRLRQVALASNDIDLVARQLKAVFGIQVAFQDPEIISYGLKNVVIPVGNEFIELVQPVVPTASAARYLERRGGDGGYMALIQSEDARADRRRLSAIGVRIVDVLDSTHHECTHFHPSEFGGTLASIDSVPGARNWREADSDWHPAGPNWRSARSGDVYGLASIDIQSDDPIRVAQLWSRALAVRAREFEDGWQINLLRARIRFLHPIDKFAKGIVAIALTVLDPKLMLERADRIQLEVQNGAVFIGGVWIRPVANSRK